MTKQARRLGLGKCTQAKWCPHNWHLQRSEGCNATYVQVAGDCDGKRVCQQVEVAIVTYTVELFCTSIFGRFQEEIEGKMPTSRGRVRIMIHAMMVVVVVVCAACGGGRRSDGRRGGGSGCNVVAVVVVVVVSGRQCDCCGCCCGCCGCRGMQVVNAIVVVVAVVVVAVVACRS